MGYRSEVSLVLTRKAIGHIFATIPEQFKQMVEYSDIFSKKDDSFLIKWNYIKWYESYDDVGALDHCINKLDSDDYHFIRIGEDNDDIEERGGYWDNPFGTSISRSINVDDTGETVNLEAFM